MSRANFVIENYVKWNYYSVCLKTKSWYKFWENSELLDRDKAKPLNRSTFLHLCTFYWIHIQMNFIQLKHHSIHVFHENRVSFRSDCDSRVRLVRTFFLVPTVLYMARFSRISRRTLRIGRVPAASLSSWKNTMVDIRRPTASAMNPAPNGIRPSSLVVPS